MGEAKRRAPRETRTDNLPNFVFARDEEVEKAGGFILAGTLVTDIPKGTEPSERASRKSPRSSKQ
jgi:hypothetical protein